MSPLDPTWIRSRVAKCNALLGYGYNGCFFDTIGVSNLQAAYIQCPDSNCVPIDPQTRRAWTNRDWLAAEDQIMARVQQAVGKKLVFGNGLRNGNSYFGVPTSSLLDSTKGMMAELFLRSPNSSVDQYPTQSQWLSNVKMLQDAARRGKSILVTTKTWTSGTVAQKAAWELFALSSFLMGESGKAYYSFQYDHTTTSADTYKPDWAAPIGVPSGPLTSSGGLFQRTFSNGQVFVNMSSVTQNVPLAQSMLNPATGSTVTSVKLPHDAGVILVGPQLVSTS
jgi:hypothetical protein